MGKFGGLLLAFFALWCVSAKAQQPEDFVLARAEVRTSIHYRSSMAGPMPAPPVGVFELVAYASPVGPLGAYITPNPGDGTRHPAIIWMTGGETNTVGDVWSPSPRENDQTAAAYRQAGIIMMFPSLRGGNNNPGRIEGFFGEIDDVLAAVDFLAQQPYVDPQRIYLGGHSTGGTLVFLVAAASNRFRAVFSFGPVARASSYGEDFIPYNFRRLPAWEERMRAPVEWMSSVRGPLFVIEGGGLIGNRDDLHAIRDANTNANIHVIEVAGASHFDVLAPANEVIAHAILADSGPVPQFDLSAAQLEAAAAASSPRPAPARLDVPRWARRPRPEDIRALYPPAALQAGVEGRVNVTCIVQEDLHLGACEITLEEPRGYGFGAASIQAAEQFFEMAPTTAGGNSAVGGRVSVPFRWFP